MPVENSLLECSNGFFRRADAVKLHKPVAHWKGLSLGSEFSRHTGRLDRSNGTEELKQTKWNEFGLAFVEKDSWLHCTRSRLRSKSWDSWQKSWLPARTPPSLLPLPHPQGQPFLRSFPPFSRPRSQKAFQATLCYDPMHLECSVWPVGRPVGPTRGITATIQTKIEKNGWKNSIQKIKASLCTFI